MTAHILVVDDDPSIREVVSDILGSEGYSVATASNGAEALEVVERTRPALVLLDMRMPVVNGWDFAREIKERGLRPCICIMVMTAARNARHWAEEINADGFVAKPFELPDLLAAVEQLHRPGLH